MKKNRTKRLIMTFKRRLFGHSYNANNYMQQLFLYQHMENFRKYKEIIANHFFPICIQKRKQFKQGENDILIQWYFQKIDEQVIVTAIEKGTNYAKKQSIKIRYLTYFRTFVDYEEERATIRYRQLSVGNPDYTDGGKDRWMYQEWLKDNKYFDLFRGPL